MLCRNQDTEQTGCQAGVEACYAAVRIQSRQAARQEYRHARLQAGYRADGLQVRTRGMLGRKQEEGEICRKQ